MPTLLSLLKNPEDAKTRIEESTDGSRKCQIDVLQKMDKKLRDKLYKATGTKYDDVQATRSRDGKHFRFASVRLIAVSTLDAESWDGTVEKYLLTSWVSSGTFTCI